MSPVRVGGYTLNHTEIETSVDYIKQNSCLFFGIAYCTLCMLYYSLFSAWGYFLEGYGQIQNKMVGYKLFSR